MKLTKTIETNNHVPPPGPGVPPAQVILNPILVALNALPQCQWSIATHVPNAGPVVQNAPEANAPGPGQKVPAPPANRQEQHNPPPPGPAIPQAQNNPPGAANPQAQNNPLPAGPVNLQGQNNRRPPGPAIPQAQNNPPGAAIPQRRTTPHLPAYQISKLRTILQPQARRIPQLRMFCPWGPNIGTHRRIFLQLTIWLAQCLSLVRQNGSNMLRRMSKVRTILPA